ncbi:MAG: hypothetical protein HY720_19490 [Planctomycetes bacterium]|nr:hypothetical protein [Planctomycetota bacterium]
MRACCLLLAAVLAAGCSLDQLDVEMDDPLPEDLSFLSTGRTTLGDALSRLGPPAAIRRAGDGFALGYQHFRADELHVDATYRGALLAYSTGDSDVRSVVLVFDSQGVLASWGSARRPLDLGWGAIVGHRLSPELFFKRADYITPSRAHLWGRRLGWPDQDADGD